MNKKVNNGTLKTIAAICAAALIFALLLGVGNILGLTGLPFAQAEKYTLGDGEVTGQIKNLRIEWTSGKVDIAYHKGDTVLFSEKANKPLTDSTRLRWLLDGDTLRIEYCKPGFHFGSWNLDKELTVTLPEGIALDSLEIDATSGDLNIPGVKAEKLRLSLTSGDIAAQAEADTVTIGCTSGTVSFTALSDAREITIGSTSGTIALTAANADTVKLSSTSGSINAMVKSVRDFRAGTTSGGIQAAIVQAMTAKIESTSGNVDVKIARLDTLKVDSTSGSVTAALPAVPGFTARIGTASGSIQNDLPLAKNNGTYTCGDGSGKVDIETTSGNIHILEFKE